VPNSREEWITYLEQAEANLKSKMVKNDRPKQNLEPLGDNEIYMKANAK
jgi:hypothetical protein